MSGSRPWPFEFYGRPSVHDWASVEHLLGKQPDVAVAKELGCKRQAVWKMRKLLDIPSFSRADIIRPLLGQHTDRVVARMCNVSRYTVARQRRAEGIAPCSRVRMIRLQRARRDAEAELE